MKISNIRIDKGNKEINNEQKGLWGFIGVLKDLNKELGVVD